jgi:hypothetical protein
MFPFIIGFALAPLLGKMAPWFFFAPLVCFFFAFGEYEPTN